MNQQANSRKNRQANVRSILFLSVLLVSSVALISFSTGVNPVAEVRSGPHQKTVPFKGRIVTTFHVLDQNTVQEVTIMGSGVTTHFGKTTFEGHVVLDLTTDPAFGNGEGTFTAANGDQIFTEYSGTTYLENGVYVGENEHIIKGGTGRFKDASGIIKASVINDRVAGTGQQTFDGYISY